MRCPRCQQENPAQASFCMTCGAGLTRAKRGTVGGVRSETGAPGVGPWADVLPC